MSECGVYECTCKSDNKDNIVPLDSPIIIDDKGSVLDGKDLKIFSLPSIPRANGRNVPSKADIRLARIRRKLWIHRLCRGWIIFNICDQLTKDLCICKFCTLGGSLPKNEKHIYVCSRHFGKEAFDQFVPMKQGMDSILEVARKFPRVRLLLPDAVPTLNLPLYTPLQDTDRQKRHQQRAHTETVAEALKNWRCEHKVINIPYYIFIILLAYTGRANKCIANNISLTFNLNICKKFIK